MTRAELAAKIKAKHPDYGVVDDNELVDKVIAKYPDYGAMLDPENSVDDVLSTQHGQGPTVGDEVVSKDLTSPSDAPYGPSQGVFNIFNGAANFAKGVGQGVFNAGRAVHQMMPLAGQAPGLLPPPQMPEELATEEGDAAAFLGRLAPTAALGAAVPASLPASVALGGLGGAMESGTPQGAAIGAGSGGLMHGAQNVGLPFAKKVAEAVQRYGWPTVKGGLEKLPILGPVGKGAVAGFRSKYNEPLRLAAEEAKKFAALEASSTDEEMAAVKAALARFNAEGRGAGAQAAKYASATKASEAEEMEAVSTAMARFQREGRGAAAQSNAAKIAAEAEAQAMKGARSGAEKEASGYFDDALEEAAWRAEQQGLQPPPFSGTSSGVKPTVEVPPTSSSPMSPPPTFKPSTPTSSVTGKAVVVPKGQTKLPTTGGGKRADLAPKEMTQTGNVVHPKNEVDFDEAIKRLQGAASPQEKGAILRELRAGGHHERVGEALSRATNKPLDPDDLSEAAEMVRQAGGLKMAESKIYAAEGLTPRERNALLRAVREASRNAK